MDIKKNFGTRLRELRIQRGLTQEKMSEIIGIQPENYSRIENGVSFPKPDNISKMASALKVELSELFQFKHLDNYEEILASLVDKLHTDKESTVLVYKFLKSLGKI
ncbi:MAG: helix-turn-helix domain-containing protein [Candidatus Gastranaerophilales bacterium]|nr:helix-turn-helix domain-containing protein [Candidatus Gastranaerophilales bacterium]